MDFQHTESEEIGFDDNGLQHAFMLASNDFIFDDDTEDCQLSHRYAVRTKIHADEDICPNLQTGESKSYRAEYVEDECEPFSHVVFSGQKDLEGKSIDHLDQPVCYTANKEGTGKLDDNSVRRLEDVETSQENVGSERSTNDRGFTDLEIADNVYGITMGEARAKEARFRSEISVKDVGDLKSIIDKETQKTAENVDSQGILLRSGEIEAKKTTFRSGFSAKHVCDLESIAELDIQTGTENANDKKAKGLAEIKAVDERFRPELSAKDGRGWHSATQLAPQEAVKNLDDRRNPELRKGEVHVYSCVLESNKDQERFENVDDRNNRKRLVEVEAKQTKGRSVVLHPSRNVYSLESFACFEKFLLLASILGRTCSTMSWQFLASLTVGILLLIHSAGVDGGLTSVPVNTLAVFGKTARLNCSTASNQPVYWTRTLAGSDEEQWLYYGIDGFHSNYADGRFSIDADKATGRFDIIITDVQPMDAGQYACIDDSGLGARTSAELVISAHINCNSLIPSDGVMGDNVFGIEQDFIHISCSLNYTGNISPLLKWIWPGNEVQSAERTVSDVVASSVASTLKMSPTMDLNNVKFQCKADIDGATQGSVDNELTWESETVIVRHAVPTSNLMDVCPGVESFLICNPPCSYNFTAKEDECQCQYTYYDSRTQQKYQTVSDPIVCSKENNNSRIALIAIAVTVPVLTMVFMFLTVCYLKKKCTTRSRAFGSRESSQSNGEEKPGEPMLEN